MINKPAQLSRPTTAGLLTRILEQPELVSAVQALPVAALSKLIDHIGLEDAAELIALASTEQLERVFEDDLFRAEQTGDAEHFDAARFPLWLELMLEAGESFTAQKLAELPEDLVTLALHRHVLVIDIEALAVAMANRRDNDWGFEKALESPLHHELDQFRLFARASGEGWDTIIRALCALDRDHHDQLERMLERCCQLSAEVIEDNGGLYEVLSSDAMLESDVSAEREDRREREGFVAARDAYAFLQRARSEEPAHGGRDPLVVAHFRALASTPSKSVGAADAHTAAVEPAARSAASEQSLAELVATLRAADVLPEAEPALLSAGAQAEDDRIVMRALEALATLDPLAHAARVEELAYLANVLLAGCTLLGRSFRPLEAGAAAVAVCNLALELAEPAPAAPRALEHARDTLRREHADVLFRRGWRALYTDVVQATAAALARASEGALTGKRPLSPAQQAQLEGLTRVLKAELARGTPWHARNQLEPLEGVLDPEALIVLTGLLGECPVLSGPLANEDEPARSTTAPEFMWIAKRPQLERARELLAQR